MRDLQNLAFMVLSGIATIVWANIAFWEQTTNSTLVAASIAIACGIVALLMFKDHISNTNSQLDNRVPNDQ